MTIDVVKNVFTPDQKEQLIEKVTAAILEVEGANMRPYTWVRINEFASGDWAIGGRRLSAADLHALAKRRDIPDQRGVTKRNPEDPLLS